MAEKRIFRFFFWLVSIGYAAFIVALYFGDYWPEKYWWIPNLILVSPLWSLLIPLVLLLLMAFRVRSIKGVYFHTLLIILFVFFLMDFRIPLKSPERLYGKTFSVKVITVNMEGIAGNSLYGYANRMEADVIVFQDFYDNISKGVIAQHFLKDGWDFISNGGLAIASKFSVVDTDFHEHYLIGVRLDTDAGDLYVYNVHLETPREGIESLINRGIIGRYDMQGATKLQIYESETASALIPRSKNVILAGDFNLPDKNPIYKKYWSPFQNSFALVGKGFGYTKYTRWHGVRIDHILADETWTVLQAEAGPSLGGDHRPMFALIQKRISENTVGQVSRERAPLEKVALPPPENIFIYEDFEDTDIHLQLATEMKRVVVFKPNKSRSYRLETGSLAYQGGSIKFPAEPFESYPKLRLSYQMLPKQPMFIRAQTQLGEWICLGATPGAECEHTQIANFLTLYNDGQWHQLEIDVISEIRTLLRGNKSIQAFEMVIPPHNANLNKVWLDDVLIYK